MTDLKTANMMLAQAIAALESPEHDADVNEAESIRNRLLDLDAAIGARIQAKLDAHRMIIDQWGVSEVVVPRRLEKVDVASLASAWEAHHAEHASKYSLSGDDVPDAVMVNGAVEMPQLETATES